MPEQPAPKQRPHPFRLEAHKDRTPPRPSSAVGYAELAVTSNYSFLRGASHPEEMVETAAALGHSAASIADRNTLAGVVRAHTAAKDLKIPLCVGSRLVLSEPEDFQIIVYPTCRDAYARLCRLLTLGKRRAAKGECRLTLDDLIEYNGGLLGIVIPPEEPGEDEHFREQLGWLRENFDDDHLSLAANYLYGPNDVRRLDTLAELSRTTRAPLVAINDVHYHIPHRRALQDVLTCVRHGCTVQDAGFRLHPNAERHLKGAEQMLELFRAYPQAVARARVISRRASAFSLDELKYEYPHEPCPPEIAPIEHLKNLCEQGVRDRYPEGAPQRVHDSLKHELAVIEKLKYEPYFLTCHDIVRFARSRGILCQGRGGAANSAVCFCLGITEVDPARFSLLFERFISRERREPPDIDIDFEHERREEVIQYIYRRYGRERAALTAEVITYRWRSAVRDVGKAMGLSLDRVDTLARNIGRWGAAPDPEQIRETGLNPDEPTLRRVFTLCGQLVGFPRHLSQHVGGFVMSRTLLSELVPIENAAMEDRTVIEWDKDDIDALGILKVDVLGLGMLTCIRKAFELIRHPSGEPLSIHRIMHDHGEDPGVYAMIQRADTIGVFQIESRAQMSMLPRLKPREFYDLVIEVAIVRPGPIQGNMVHPYLRRRTGQEPITFPTPEVETVLKRTLGVPLFQEQAMQLAIVAGGFTPDEADRLRRAMAAWKRKGNLIYQFGQKLVAGMTERGYPAEFAARCFEQIKGFSEYGFPESHAASFAILVYVSSWLKHHHPAAFAAALLNSQPMGFYQPAQIVRDAKEHGVEVRGIDINHSRWDCTLEETVENPVLRLGMRLVKGLPEADARRIAEAARDHGPLRGVDATWRRSGASVRAMRCLARADALGSLGLDRQAALWAVRNLRDEPLPLFDAPRDDDPEETLGKEMLPPLPPPDQTLHDYRFTGLSLKEHPIAFLRERLTRRGVIPAGDLRDEDCCCSGRIVRVGGMVLVRQRPSTASGVVFVTLEDETGIANIIIWADTYEKWRRVVNLSGALMIEGRIEREGEVVHIHAQRFRSLDEAMPELPSQARNFH